MFSKSNGVIQSCSMFHKGSKKAEVMRCLLQIAENSYYKKCGNKIYLIGMIQYKFEYLNELYHDFQMTKILYTYRRVRRTWRSNLTEIMRVIRWKITKHIIHIVVPICSKFQKAQNKSKEWENKMITVTHSK